MNTCSFKIILYVIVLMFSFNAFAKTPKISKEYKRAICSKKTTTVTHKENKTVRLNKDLDCEGRANRLGLDPRACELCVVKLERSESKTQTSKPSDGDTTTDDNGGEDEEESGGTSNGGGTSGGTKPDKGGNPNNGHGNDKDRNDDSNRGKSNDQSDNTDDDGSKDNGNGKSNR